MTGVTGRRVLLLGGLGAAGSTAVGSTAAGWPALTPASAAETDAAETYAAETDTAAADAGRSAPPAAGDLLVRVDDDASVHVVPPSALRVGAAPLLVWPMQPQLRIVRSGTRFNQVLLLRLASGSEGVAAFSAICTHASCLVSGWDAAAGRLVCPCHASAYAARREGAVVDGPAPRPLPGLPVASDDGVLRVMSGFDARVGGDSGRTM